MFNGKIKGSICMIKIVNVLFRVALTALLEYLDLGTKFEFAYLPQSLHTITVRYICNCCLLFLSI